MAQSWLTRGAATAERSRRRMQKTGITSRGDRIWTEQEIATAKRLYPDYQAICKALGRTYSSVRHRCRQLGLAPKRHVWTAPEIARLRKMYPTATKEELRAAFHGFSYLHISRIATNYGFKRARRPFKPTGFDVIDQIRERSFQLGYSMPDLDELSRTKSYFTQQQWHSSKTVNYEAATKAIRALDGKVSAQWND